MALVVLLGGAGPTARADTRSDVSIFCLDVLDDDPGVVTYPVSMISRTNARTVPGGFFSWDLASSGWMPGAGVANLTQTAEAWTEFQNVTVDFGAGCQFFTGTESRIVVRGTRTSAPGEFGTAPALIRVRYHVILENEYDGSGASVGAVNGINVFSPGQFGNASLMLNDSGGAPLLSVPMDAIVTDQSVGALTRKEVEGEVVVSDMLAYGPLAQSLIGITFFAGTQTSASNPGGTPVTAQAAALGGETAVTEVTSLDPEVTFTVVPEPASAPGATTALAGVALLAAARRDRGSFRRRAA